VAETRRGFLLGAAAYAMWGLFPLYWPLLEPAGAVEILAHRIVWSLIVMAALVVVLNRRRAFARMLAVRRTRWLLLVAAVVISVNWGGFIFGVTTVLVVAVSRRYHVNPLVAVLMGVVVLGERLRPLQWVAMGLATLAVLGLTLEYGRPPWIALALAFSFGTYGLAKKKAGAGAVESLTFETAVLTPVALGYIAWLAMAGQAHFGNEGTGHAVLIATTGLVTAVPLICFGAAATRVPLTTIGLLQYIAPTLQFALGVLVFQEPMPATRWVGFALVWVALAIFTAETLNRRRQLRLTAQASAL